MSGGTYAYPEGCLVVSGFMYLGSVFSYVSITDFTKSFWSGDAYFGNQDSTSVSSLHFSILQFLVQTLEVWHSPEAFDCANCSGLTGLIACWGDALSLSKFFASSLDLSGSLLMGSGPNAAKPRFPE